MVAFIYAAIIDPLLRNVRIHIPDFAEMKAGHRVLDICCGTGDQVIKYARRGIIATGIDRNPDMIRLAERNRKKYGLKNASLQVADAVELPFQDNVFDYASISFALHEIGRMARDKVVSEMKRVVKGGGGLVFLDFQMPLPGNIYAYLARTIEFIVGGDHHRHFKDYIRQGGLEVILKENGLFEVERNYGKNSLMAILKARNV